MTRTLDVAVIAEINPDIVVEGLHGLPALGTERLVDGVTLAPGSSGVLTALGLAALGLRVALLGLVGDDPFGRYMLARLDAAGIDRAGVVVDAGERTGASVILSGPRDRAILTFPGTIARFGIERVRFDVLRRCRHVHLSSYFLQEALRPAVPLLLRRAHDDGLTTSVDTGHDPAEQWAIDDLLAHVDMFLPNEVEACGISGAPDATVALGWLGARVSTAVVKQGATGAIATRAGACVTIPGFPIDVRDTTGAGDAFNAGMIGGLLAGENLVACVRRGNACGALAAAHVGGAGGFDPARVEALLATRP